MIEIPETKKVNKVKAIKILKNRIMEFQIGDQETN